LKNKAYRSLEEILAGYYDFGDNYYVIVSSEIRHPHYTAVHERTHINIGKATTFGVFQEFLETLNRKTDYKYKPKFLEEIKNLALEEVRDLHESASTYCEFIAAEEDRYPYLADMLISLPPEYRKWKKVLDDFFSKQIPLRGRRILAENLARLAMDNSIIEDYKILTEDKIKNFRCYISLPENSPNTRFKHILSILSSYNQLDVFKKFIDLYDSVADDLDQGYSSRSYENRKITYGIQTQLFETINLCFNDLSSEHAIFKKSIIDSEELVVEINSLVKGWIDYFKNKGYCDSFHFSFINSDAECDVLDTKYVVSGAHRPQPGLLELKKLNDLPNPDFSLSRIWIHKDAAPFLLCDKTKRYLTKGDIYIRIMPANDSFFNYYLISKSYDVLNELFKIKNNCTVFDGHDYTALKDKISTGFPKFFYWRCWDEFEANVCFAKECEFIILELKKQGALLFVVYFSNDTYHLMLSIGGGASLIFEELTRKTEKQERLLINNKIMKSSLQLVIAYADYIF
jgi:hypothetical protein